MKIIGFNWDKGNWPKCGKHGLTKSEIEEIFLNSPSVHPDPFSNEERLRAIGKNNSNRYIFAVFTYRYLQNGRMIRPLSARYMHRKEIEHYEQQAKA